MAKKKKQKDLSKTEWKVMKIVWDLGKGMAREVYTVAAEEQGWSATTVKTLLKRLVDKGYLTASPVGNGFVYRPASSAIAVLQDAADQLLTHAVDGTTGPLIAHMVQQTNLSESDVDELQKLIDAKKTKFAKRKNK